MAKSKRNKNEHYAIRHGSKPGIYESYGTALGNKFSWDERPVIRGFQTREEAEYYLRTGKVMQSKKKRKTEIYYVLRRGLKPGIYEDWEEAVRNKFPDDDTSVIRGFLTREKAEYYYTHGKDMPDDKQDGLWKDDD